MDNILRRPMFRGGRVENRGGGITSALGYADGGRIGFNVGGYPPLVGSSYGKDFTMTRLPARTAGVPMVIPQAATTGRELMVIPQSGTTGGSLLRGGSSLARYLTPTFAPTIGIASLLNPETEEEQKAIADLEEGTGMSGEAIDPELYNLLSTEVGKTRAAEDRVFSKGSTGVLQRIYDTLNPSAETILSRLQESQKQQGEPIIKTQAYRKEEAARTKLEEQLAKQLQAKNEANVADKINKITTDTTTVEVPEKSNRDVMNEYMDMFKSVLGEDQDELTRQRYLELAKFGTNLLAQGGGKRSTLEKIGAAGTQSIEGLSKIAAQERASDRQIKLAGLQAALKEIGPGTLGQQVKDLQKLGVPKSKAIEYITKSGTGVREQTRETKIKEYTDLIADSDGAPKDKRLARVIAEKIDKTNIGFEKFEPLPTNTKPEEGGYFYDKQGNLFIGTKTGVKRIL
jgi:hypothetical protein